MNYKCFIPQRIRQLEKIIVLTMCGIRGKYFEDILNFSVAPSLPS